MNEVKHFFIKNIDENSVYMQGGVYLHKIITERNKREQQRKMDKIGLNSRSSTLSSINDFQLAEIENEFRSRSSNTQAAQFRKRIQKMKEDADKLDPYSYDSDSKITEKGILKDEFISTDMLILMIRSPLEGSNLYNFDECSIFVRRTDDGLFIGELVDKQSYELLFEIQGGIQ